MRVITNHNIFSSNDIADLCNSADFRQSLGLELTLPVDILATDQQKFPLWLQFINQTID